MPAAAAVVLSLFLMVSLWPLSYHSRVAASPGVLSFDIHHRFSSNVRRWAEFVGRDTDHEFWPEKGSVQYYDWLFSHDKALLHRRGLAGEDRPTLTFADGNATIQFGGRLGFLHFANISLGTPKVDILVALDTGSDLLWVPCNCENCTNTSIYNSASSSTSKQVSCNSSLCQQQLLCTRPSDSCPYQVRYLDGTSSSGVLTEDLLYLTTTDSTQQQQSVNASVTFGCAAAATGFTSGIFGLGFSKISVPSTLVNAGLVSDSFSMCFGLTDEVGRINFGDKGGLDQRMTPLAPNVLNQDYVVTVKAINVNNRSVSEDFFAIIDSGFSFTILKDPTYTQFAEAFDSEVVDARFPRIPEFPFEYCYQPPSLNLSSINPPNVSLTMEGGSDFPLLRSVVRVSITDTIIYCLGIIKSENLNIIGQNFMSGLKLVFDREKLVLGWKEFNCYDVENSINTTTGTTPAGTAPVTPSPLPAPPSNRGTENGVIKSLHTSLSLVLVVVFVLLLA